MLSAPAPVPVYAVSETVAVVDVPAEAVSELPIRDNPTTPTADTSRISGIFDVRFIACLSSTTHPATGKTCQSAHMELGNCVYGTSSRIFCQGQLRIVTPRGIKFTLMLHIVEQSDASALQQGSPEDAACSYESEWNLSNGYLRASSNRHAEEMHFCSSSLNAHSAECSLSVTYGPDAMLKVQVEL